MRQLDIYPVSDFAAGLAEAAESCFADILEWLAQEEVSAAVNALLAKDCE